MKDFYNGSAILKEIQEVSNFPAKFVFEHNSEGISGRFPKISDIQFSNTYWQLFEHPNGTFNLLNAYYDNRVSKSPTIRILGSVKLLEPSASQSKVICQLWFKNLDIPVISPVTEYLYLWRKEYGYQKNKFLHPYLLCCKIPKLYRYKVPLSVSLVHHMSDTASNVLKIINNRPANGVKKKFGVCVKQLDFFYNDMSVILIEWLELLFSMGVEKVHIYNLIAHDNIIKVLRYYEKLRKVELSPISLPGYQPNIPSFYHKYLYDNMASKNFLEVMLFNDCFYRNMYEFEWLAVLDVDELIMPGGTAKTWSHILQKIKTFSKFDEYSFRNVYFFDENKYLNVTRENVAPYLHYSKSIHRALNFSREGFWEKSLYSTDRVLTIHNHYAIECVKGKNCRCHEVDITIARLQHYCFNKKCTDKEPAIIDYNIRKYTYQITRSTLKTLEELNFIRMKK